MCTSLRTAPLPAIAEADLPLAFTPGQRAPYLATARRQPLPRNRVTEVIQRPQSGATEDAALLVGLAALVVSAISMSCSASKSA